jgi:hypothetical protein
MFVVISWQFGLVAPWSELVLLVPVRWSSPDLDVDIALVSGMCLVVGGKQQQECQEDGARCEDSLRYCLDKYRNIRLVLTSLDSLLGRLTYLVICELTFAILSDYLDLLFGLLQLMQQ